MALLEVMGQIDLKLGRLTDAVQELDGARGWRAARLRKSLLAELAMLEPGRLTLGTGARPAGRVELLWISAK